MSRIIRLSVAFILGFTCLVTPTPAQAATTYGTAGHADHTVAAVRVLRYDASRAAEFRSAEFGKVYVDSPETATH